MSGPESLISLYLDHLHFTKFIFFLLVFNFSVGKVFLIIKDLDEMGKQGSNHTI